CYAIDCDIASKLLGRHTYIRDKAGQRIAFWEGRRDEVVDSLKQDIPELFQKLDVYDLIHLRKIAIVPPRGYHPPEPKQIEERVWETESGQILKYSPITNEIAAVSHKTNWDQQFTEDQFPVDPEVTPEDESIYEVWDAVVDRLPPDRYIIGHYPMAREQILLGGYERGLVEVAMNPEIIERAGESERARVAKQRKLWKRREFDGVMNENDFGHTTGTFVSPEAFRRLFLPNVTFNAEAIHAQGWDFIQHSCGDNRPIFDQLVEAGIDCLQSLQPQAGMSPAMVKERSGGRMAAWGGVDVANLVKGSTDDVRRDVRETMETAKAGGGLILGASHSIAWGTKYDNFMAMLDEFEKTRDY
ncbi:MAG: uroporphyrinogen decarboxylase family protein, partial [Armatimonadota bacterium]